MARHKRPAILRHHSSVVDPLLTGTPGSSSHFPHTGRVSQESSSDSEPRSQQEPLRTPDMLEGQSRSAASPPQDDFASSAAGSGGGSGNQRPRKQARFRRSISQRTPTDQPTVNPTPPPPPPQPANLFPEDPGTQSSAAAYFHNLRPQDMPCGTSNWHRALPLFAQQGPHKLPALLARNPSITTIKHPNRQTIDKWKSALQFTLDLLQGYPDLHCEEAKIIRSLWHCLPLLLLRVNPVLAISRQNRDVSYRIHHFLQGRWETLLKLEEGVSFDQDGPAVGSGGDPQDVTQQPTAGLTGSGRGTRPRAPQGRRQQPNRQNAGRPQGPDRARAGVQQPVMESEQLEKKKILSAVEHYQNRDMKKARQALVGHGLSPDPFEQLWQQTREKFPTRLDPIPPTLLAAVGSSRQMLSAQLDDAIADA